MKENKKVANGLVALSSAAILAVYAAGYLRTRSAADRFALEAAERRPAPPTIASVERVVEPERLAPAHVAAVDAPPVVRAAPPPSMTVPAPASAPATLAVTAEEPPTPAPDASAPAAASVPVVAVAPVAPVAPEPPQVPPPQALYKDGTYYGWGTSRHGDIQAAVVIQEGRIASATIAQCLTRYSCSVIARLPPQVAARQSPEIDYVSGATQSTNAFYYAVVEALSKAR